MTEDGIAGLTMYVPVKTDSVFRESRDSGKMGTTFFVRTGQRFVRYQGLLGDHLGDIGDHLGDKRTDSH
jgi:hypothetical protein